MSLRLLVRSSVPSPPEQCPICSKIPKSCSKSHHYEDGLPAHTDDTPPEIKQLVVCFTDVFDGTEWKKIVQCPTCSRLYSHEVSIAGESTFWSWERIDRMTDNVDVAKRCALLVDSIDHPTDVVRRRFQDIPIKQGLWTFEERNVESAREAVAKASGGSMEPTAERNGENVIVRFWGTSQNRLTHRTITMKPDETYVSDDEQHGWLPIVLPRQPIFESLDAFRTHCGVPTMPIEQCPICSELPQCSYESDGAPMPAEVTKLENFIGEDIRRCPTCHHLYHYERTSYGNDIYTGNDSSESFERLDVDQLFDVKWCVEQRLPSWTIQSIRSDQFFPSHVLLSLGDRDIGALSRDNELVKLDSAEALAKLIERDPPRVTHDLELAMRYGIFVDKHERPQDRRPSSWDLLGWNPILTAEQERACAVAKAATLPDLAPGAVALLPATATREGDSVIVCLWVTSNKRLNRRRITVQPDGRYTHEDEIVTGELPIEE